MRLISMDSYGIFADRRDTARANSLVVAQMFEKNHKEVLRDIERLECSDGFRERNFALSSYKSEQNKKLPCYDMTREQIGAALEYANPQKAMDNLHAKHRDRLDQFSVTLKVRATDGKAYNTTLYTRKGIMEICRWSQQPKADAFMDWTWEVMDGLMSGKTKLVKMTEYQRMTIETRAENARVRKAQILERIANQYDGTYKQVLHAHATKELTGEYLLPLPELAAKTYTAAEIGERLGISAQMVGILTNRHNLKTEQYGTWFCDKAKHCDKEVQTFRYYETVIPALDEILKAA